jgi:hypothetical protein
MAIIFSLVSGELVSEWCTRFYNKCCTKMKMLANVKHSSLFLQDMDDREMCLCNFTI